MSPLLDINFSYLVPAPLIPLPTIVPVATELKQHVPTEFQEQQQQQQGQERQRQEGQERQKQYMQQQQRQPEHLQLQR